MKKTATISSLLAMALTASPVIQAESMPTDPIGGKPPAGAKASVADLEYQVKYQRAFEAVVWAIPAVSIYGFVKSFEKLGVKDNTIMAFSKPAGANAEILTANNVTPYITGFTDLRNGPTVIEIPAVSDKASLYGQIVDHWQVTLADVGPSGIDKGKGGKILLIPPGYKGEVPSGYLELKSPSFRVNFAFRSIPGEKSSVKNAHEYAQTLKMYYLSELPKPKPTKFIDPTNMRWETLPVYDETYFEDIHAIFSIEQSYPRDKVMMGMLASLGIEKGKPYNPDEKTKKAMRQAAIDAYFYMKELFLDVNPAELWWKDRQWRYALYSDPNDGFTWESDELLDIDSRAAHPYSWGTYFPNKMPKKPATAYLATSTYKGGKQMEAGKTYSLNIPANMPVNQFWALIIYDFDTMAFIYTKEQREGLSSKQIDEVKKNADGSVTLYFGPKAPEGLDGNWIPTSGKRPFPIVRFYSPTDAFYDKTFKMPDIELVK